MVEFDLAEQVELVGDAAGGVLFGDVVEDFLPVGFATEIVEVVAIAGPHQIMHRSGFVDDQVGDPGRSTGLEKQPDLFKRGLAG